MSFLKAWQLSLRSCSIRNSLGLLRFLTSKSASTEQWQKIHDLIDFHITQRLDERLAKPDERQPSLLDHLIDQTRDTLEIRNQIIQGMMAAQDTTSILISNTIFLLSRHPVIWRRLREEQASVDLEFFNSESAKRPGLLLNVLHECK